MKLQTRNTRFLIPTVLCCLGLLPSGAAAGATAGPASDLPDSWLAQVEAGIAASEYSISWADTPADGGPACYQAPNRRQNLRFLFRDDGEIGIIDRTAKVQTWKASLRPISISREGKILPLGRAVLRSEEARAIYSFSTMTEENLNQPEGLIQTFTIDQAPEGQGALSLQMAIDGNITLHRTSLGNLELRSGGTKVLKIRALEASDASGRRLQLRMSAEAGSLDLTVDDEGALYPLQLKSMLSLPAASDWTARGSSDAESFGYSVATAGDVNGDGYSDIAIGVPYYDVGGLTNAGQVYLYLGSASGISAVPDWNYAGGGAWWETGHVVATAGDVNGDGYSDLAIGIPSYAAQIGPDLIAMGALAVFYGSSSGLPSQPDWDRTNPLEENNSGFGFAVASAGDVNGDGYSDLLFSEPFFDDSGSGGNPPEPDTGIVYLRYGSDTGLADGSEWYFYGWEWGDGQSGYALATAGDINGDGYSDFIIGQPYYSSPDHSDCGKAVVFLGGSSGPQETHYQVTGTQDDEHLGMALSTAGDVNGDGYSDIILGIPDYTTTTSGEGVAYLYYGGSTFDTTADWFAFGETEDGNFGASVSFAGDTNGDGYADVLIGEPGFTDTQTGEGRALMWLGSATGPALGTAPNANWKTVSSTAGAHYGASVATAGDVNGDGWADVLVGAPDYSYSYTGEGVAFAFYGGPDSLADTAHWGVESDWADSNLGTSVAGAGDVNGDGYSDIIAGAPNYDSSFSNEGAVLLYLGSATGPSSTPSWFARGSQADANFGWAVNSAGDVNGDGYSDIIIGAPYYDYSAVDSGAIFVFLGSSSGMGSDGSPTSADWFGISAYGGGLMGYAASSAGDVNGDGYADIAGGAPGYSDGTYSAEGGVFVWHGSATGLGADGDDSNADWHYYGGETNKSLGTSVAPAGDVNWDGYADLLAGGANLAVVWEGSTTGLKTDGISWGMSQGDLAYLFGRSVSGAGDINGDGYSDIVVGAPAYTQIYSNEGAAWAYCGSSTGLSSSPCWWDTGFKENAYFGMSVASAGDLNGDGYTEITVGAPGWSNPMSNEGQARVYFGSSSGPISYNDGDWTVESNYTDASLGRSVAGVGDVNGDGYGDLLIGLSGYANGQTDEGRLSLFYGNGRPGVSILPRQLQSNASSPVAPQGRSDSETSFALRILARNAAGRSPVGLQSEVDQAGDPFNLQNTSGISPQNPTSVGGLLITQTATGLTKDTAYHWRTRVLNSPVNSPLSPPFSRWYHMSSSGANESVLRTAGTSSPQPSPIFSDDFESGDLSAWTSHSP